jgi:hypothetical protein
MKAAIETLKTQEEKDKFAAQLMDGALHLDRDQISDNLRDELIKTAFELAGNQPEPLPKPPDGSYPLDL